MLYIKCKNYHFLPQNCTKSYEKSYENLKYTIRVGIIRGGVIVGLFSGCYSSMFISGGFISAGRKNWKPEFGVHHSEKSMKKGVLQMDSGVTV